MKNLIKVGKIVNTHGIKGEVRILSDFPYKEEVFTINKIIYIDKENKEIINSYRKHKNFDMITLKGYTNINEVLKYKGKMVYVDYDGINLPKDNYLDEDLIGLTVISDNKEKGTIKNIERYANTALFIIEDNDKKHIIPYNKELIEKIDINNKKVYIKDIKGLF